MKSAKKKMQFMKKFKEGEIKCLCATDVAARGIDVNDLAMVINYDLPNEAENYVHRIGRTARAGKSGKAYTFCSEQDVYSLPAIERYIGKSIPARVAEEALMAEDKSKGVYIKLDSYHEDYKDKSDYGRKKQSEYEKRNSSRSKFRKSGERGNGRYSSKNESAKSEYKRDRRVFNKSEEEMLSKMSTDERMKFYKERYSAASKSSASVSNSSTSKSASKKSGNFNKKAPGTSAKNSKAKNYRKSSNPVKTNAKHSSQKSVQKTPAKTGLLGKLKSFFLGRR